MGQWGCGALGKRRGVAKESADDLAEVLVAHESADVLGEGCAPLVPELVDCRPSPMIFIRMLMSVRARTRQCLDSEIRVPGSPEKRGREGGQSVIP